MAGDQLPLFQRKTYKGIIPAIPMAIQPPTAEKTVLQTLTAYYSYLREGGYSQYTPDDFTGLAQQGVIAAKANPMLDIANRRIAAPLPEVLFEAEAKQLLAAASHDS